MDSQEKEQAFDAIYMAILHGYVNAARCAFDKTLESVIEEKLEEVIKLAIGKGAFCLVEDINQLKSKEE